MNKDRQVKRIFEAKPQTKGKNRRPLYDINGETIKKRKQMEPAKARRIAANKYGMTNA